MEGRWVYIEQGPVTLRCWWNNPQKESEHIVLVLPEVFGVNSWARSVVDRLAEEGIPALAMPLFARTAPELDLGYSEDDLVEGRRHKEQTTTSQILDDGTAALNWLKQQYIQSRITVIGFCFGGHAALITSTLSDVDTTFDFYGAGVSTTRPGGGPPSLELLSQTSGKLTCICGTGDPLIPEADRTSIQLALREADPFEVRLSYLEIEDADHGFMCEQRASFSPNASTIGWQLIMNAFKE